MSDVFFVNSIIVGLIKKKDIIIKLDKKVLDKFSKKFVSKSIVFFKFFFLKKFNFNLNLFIFNFIIILLPLLLLQVDNDIKDFEHLV